MRIKQKAERIFQEMVRAKKDEIGGTKKVDVYMEQFIEKFMEFAPQIALGLIIAAAFVLFLYKYWRKKYGSVKQAVVFTTKDRALIELISDVVDVISEAEKR